MTSHITVAYVGSVIPEISSLQNSGYSPAGNMFQLNLLRSLTEAGVPISKILGQRPDRSFPNSPTPFYLPASYRVPGLECPLELIPFLNLPVLRPLTTGFWILLCLVWWAFRQPKDMTRIMYIYNLSEPPGLFVAAAAWLTGSKLAANINDIHIPGEQVPNTAARRLDYWLHRKLIPRLDAMVTVSSAIVQDFAPSVPYIFVEGGVTDAFLQALNKPAACETQEGLHLVFAGHLSPTNGIDIILKATELLPDPDLRLTIAGRGPLAELVEQAAARDSRIRNLGLVSFEQVLELYSAADVLLNVRRTQDEDTRYFFPSKLIEYLASGVATISTATGHVRNEYGDYCFLLEDETPEGLARLIREVKARPAEERRQRADRGRAYASTEKTWRRQGEKVRDLLLSL